MNRARTLTSLLITAGVAVVLHELRRRVAAPTSWAPQELAPWIERHGAATLAVAVARIAALTVAVYASIVSAIALTIDVLRLDTSFATKLVPKLLRGMVGLGIAGTFSVPTLAAASEGDVPVLVQVGEVTTTSTAAPPPTLVQVGSAAPTATPVPTTSRAAPPVAGAAATWEVRAGDHLWSIARATLAAHGIDASDDATVARYWRVLVDANRDRLVTPGNPDLILPGQQLVVPRVR